MCFCLKAVSLFCGPGGLDYGFIQSGVDIVLAIDDDPYVLETHRANMDSHTIKVAPLVLPISYIPDVDIVLSQFPLQGLTLDNRKLVVNSLYYAELLRVLEAKAPAAFVIVTSGVAYTNPILLDVIASSIDGYSVKYDILKAQDYGVPQFRRYIVFIGMRQDLGISFAFPKSDKHTTIRDVLYGFPDPEPSDVCMQPFNQSYMSRPRRKDWDDISYEIPIVASNMPLHPSSPEMIRIASHKYKFADGIPRRFAWWEAALLHSFPIEYKFAGNLNLKYRQIGQSVPPLLARAIAENILHI